jgi:hypothetical protein
MICRGSLEGATSWARRLLVCYVAFDVELRLSPRWVGNNIGSTDATLKAYIFETNNRKLINNTSSDSL